jgi:hypothetical protein
MPKQRPNPPQEGEGALENIKNALAMLAPVEEEPNLFDSDDVWRIIEAVNVRLRRAVQQLERR